MLDVAIGVAIQGASAGLTPHQYTVTMLNGGTTGIAAAQAGIREHDFLATGQRDQNKIRRVGSINCQSPEAPPPEHHRSAGTNCDAVKRQLSSADTDDEVELAIRPVKVCFKTDYFILSIHFVNQGSE